MSNFIDELKRRKVIRVVLAYVVVGWLLIQVAEATFEPMGLPPWSLTLVIVLIGLGLPLAVVLAWAFDITTSGLKKTESEPAEAHKPEAGSDIPSVAVLPFADMSPEQDNEYFADGLTEELLNVLSKAGGMRVSSRTSSFAFKGQSANIKSVAEQLDVAHIVEGSVRKAGKLLRITSQLIEASTDSHLWSETYDRELNDVFAIQDEIARQIASALKVKLAPEALPEATTENVRAYDYFLRGRNFFHMFGPGNISRAIEMYEKAVVADPAFARAWAAIAISKATFAMIFMVGGEERAAVIEDAKAAAARSHELAPDLADSHLATGMALMGDGKPADAEVEFKTAVELDPQMHEAFYQYARAEYMQGRMDKAAQLFEKALEVDPKDYRSQVLVSAVYQSLGRPDKAAEASRLGAAMVEQHVKKFPDDRRALALGAGAMEDIGETEKAELYAERALAIDPEDENTRYNVACYYIRKGDFDKAMDLLETCSHSARWIENDSDLDPLRELPRFKAYIKNLA